MRSPHRILVLGRDGRSTLSIVRSLGRAGTKVDLAWCLAGDAPAKSKYVARRYDIPVPTADKNWLDALKGLLAERAYELVIPSSDLEVIPLVLARRELESLARLAIPSDEMFQITFDKRRTIALVERLGLSVPRWRELEPGALRLPEEIVTPCVLKPISSFDLHRPSQTKQYVTHAFNREHADELLAKMPRTGPVIAQEYFSGRGVGVELLAKDGRILAAFQHERLHEPPEGGGSSYRKAVALDRELLTASRTLVGATRYTGVMMVEFKRNADGHWIFVEINARFWGSLPLTIAADSDMPRWLVEMMLDGREDFPQAYCVGRRARNLLGDLVWFVRNWRGDHSNSELIWVERWRSLFQFIPLLMGRDHLDLYAWDDPRPMGAPFQQIGRRFWENLRARFFAPRARLGPDSRVLFLCRGNICRSPFAELRLKAARPKQVVMSAGSYLHSGRRSPPQAVATARGFGVALEHHRSRTVDEAMLLSADEIVVFHPAELAWLRTNHPRHAGKASYLGGVPIADPLHSGSDGFRACYGRIDEMIGRLC